MASLPEYAELHCLSNFSFLRGASHPEELVAQAVAQGYTALALTDDCSLAGVVRAHLAAKEAGLKLIVGSEMVVTMETTAGPGTGGLRLVFLAGNRHGYGNLSALITLARRRAEKGCYLLQRFDLEVVSPSGASRAVMTPIGARARIHDQVRASTPRSERPMTRARRVTKARKNNTPAHCTASPTSNGRAKLRGSARSDTKRKSRPASGGAARHRSWPMAIISQPRAVTSPVYPFNCRTRANTR